MFYYESSFNSSYESVNTEVGNLLEKFKKDGLMIDSGLNFIIGFALRELFNNAVEHGNKMEVCKEVTYCLKISEGIFDIRVTDCGSGFDLNSIKELERQDSCMRKRNRGLVALEDMGFILEGQKNKVIALLKLV